MELPEFHDSYCRIFATDHVGMMGDAPCVAAFFRQFYKRFTAYPDIAEVFAGTDMEHQADMLKLSLFELTSCAVPGQPSKELTRLAALHHRLGITPKMLDEWVEALLNTVEFFDDHHQPATRQAWLTMMTPGVEYLRNYRDGDTPAPAPQPARRRGNDWLAGMP